jgi:hypothetical protein
MERTLLALDDDPWNHTRRKNVQKKAQCDDTA